MRLKEGRFGSAEAVSVAVISICVSGVFGIDPSYAYAGGNSTYLSVPLAVLISLAVLLPLIRAMERTHSSDLADLFAKTLGAFAPAAAIPICLILLFTAQRPLSVFAQVLHGLVYDGVDYTSILAFILPAALFVAWKGAEAVARTAKCIVWLLAASLGIMMAAAAPGFETYRLYPLMGDGAAHFAAFTASGTVMFLPPLIGLTIMGKALQGTAFIRKSAVRAAFISASVLAGVMLAQGLAFRAETLSGSLMPLYRITFLSPKPGFMLRLDKLFIMIWLMGCIVSGAYCIYASALLFAKVTCQKDVRPAVSVMGLTVCSMLISELAVPRAVLKRVLDLAAMYGAIFAALPVGAACAAGLIKSGKERI